MSNYKKKILQYGYNIGCFSMDVIFKDSIFGCLNPEPAGTEGQLHYLLFIYSSTSGNLSFFCSSLICTHFWQHNSCCASYRVRIGVTCFRGWVHHNPIGLKKKLAWNAGNMALCGQSRANLSLGALMSWLWYLQQCPLCLDSFNL